MVGFVEQRHVATEWRICRQVRCRAKVASFVTLLPAA